MAIERIVVHSQVKGSMGELDDDWTLLVDPATGEKRVEHSWSHADPYKGRPTRSGTTELSVDEFLAGDAPTLVKDKLTKLLAE